MPSQIETELRNRCASTENFRLLLAQWEYDRLLLGQALTAVGHAFPHYSLHDATHSETILERIAAMLGSAALSQLSATDLWLLLEAAYLHDSGMVVLEATRRKDLVSADFELYLKRTAEGEDRELAARANRLLDRQITQNGLLGMLEGHLDLLLVYAEYVRKQHARRAEAVALAPLETTRIESPRTLLLPNRFWYLIGRICRAHGESRDFVLSELPFEESGVGGELCHPRFVACMLRLGDLLDLDSGRFCPTINATIPQLPSLSEAHRSKHAGIRHLLVCPSRIEVSGVYADLNSYLEAERWFSWLREELSAQLVQWAEIAPSSFSPLPSAGRIEAHLEGQIILAPASRPRFEVDREKMIELVQGANIYGGPEDAVREIIQNAIDATLLRYSYEAQARGMLPPRDIEELREQLESYPITVTLERSSAVPENGDKVEWALTVLDRGIGIRTEDAKLMLTLGSSRRNVYRRALRDWLPEWARPSGTFGIGFHSLFLYSHDVHVVTRHPDDSNGLELTFTAPSLNTEPTVIIRRRSRPGTEVNFAPQAGTLVEAKLWFERFPSQWSPYLLGRLRRRLGMSAFSRYDFVLDKEIPLAQAAISELVHTMATGSICHLQPLGCLQPLAPSIPPNGEGPSPKVLNLYYFDVLDCLEVRVIALSLSGVGIVSRYRGAPANSAFAIGPFGGECDLHAFDASTILELSRNALTEEGSRIIYTRLQSVLRKAFPTWLANLRLSPELNAEAIGFMSLYGMANNIPDCGDEWRSVEIEKSITMGAIADAHALSWIQFSSGSTGTRVEDAGDHFTVREVGSSWFSKVLVEHFPSRVLEFVSDSAATSPSSRRYRLTKGAAGEDVTDEALSALLMPPKYHSDRGLIRRIIPCPLRFMDLSFKPSGHLARFAPGDLMMINAVMASPFVFNNADGKGYSVDIIDVERYVLWLAEQRSDSKENVAVRLFAFIQHVDHLMEDKWRSVKQYDLKEIERNLSRVANE